MCLRLSGEDNKERHTLSVFFFFFDMTADAKKKKKKKLSRYGDEGDVQKCNFFTLALCKRIQRRQGSNYFRRRLWGGWIHCNTGVNSVCSSKKDQVQTL